MSWWLVELLVVDQLRGHSVDITVISLRCYLVLININWGNHTNVNRPRQCPSNYSFAGDAGSATEFMCIIPRTSVRSWSAEQEKKNCHCSC
ncbi:hypothetical protein BDR05DRAFT_84017 [Suillus weaverae]|nr:hypothetical protein BDR05DRAFT_84017 [Suillus weaverae]